MKRYPTILVMILGLAICAATMGCATTPEQREQREYARAERDNQCADMKRQCFAAGGRLVSLSGDSFVQCPVLGRQARYCPNLTR